LEVPVIAQDPYVLPHGCWCSANARGSLADAAVYERRVCGDLTLTNSGQLYKILSASQQVAAGETWFVQAEFFNPSSATRKAQRALTLIGHFLGRSGGNDWADDRREIKPECGQIKDK
jgi:hypothetical protein